MNNELTIKSIDSTDYSVMSKAMGLSSESNGSSSSSIRLPILRIHKDALMQDSKINGKKIKEEILPEGSYELKIIDDKNSYFSNKISIRIFMQRFMYKKFFGATKKYEKTVLSDNLNMDLKDTMGTFNLGRPLGFNKDWGSLPEKTKELIKSVKRTRVIFGKIKMLDKVVDSSYKDIVDFKETPFMWEVDNNTAFKVMGTPINTLSKMQLIPINYPIEMTTVKQTIPSGYFYLPAPNLDLNKTVDITDDDHTLFTQFQEWVQNTNNWVSREWENNISDDMSQDDKDIVDNFIDIDTSEGTK
tara:strand:+ start:340 stop:1242 length:903 start_codon:yes stop_codon:yes gene_type:complete